MLDLVDYHTPNFYGWVMLWYYVSPFVTVMLAGLIPLSIWRMFFESHSRSLAPLGMLPDWPLKPGDPGPGIVVGEVHHPVNLQPFPAHHPGAGPVHRSGHLRSRRFGQDLGLPAPVRGADFVLAGGRWRGLSGDHPRGALAMEPARFLLARLHRLDPDQSTPPPASWASALRWCMLTSSESRFPITA